MGFLVLNNARTTLSGAVTAGDTSLPVADGSSFAVGSDYSYITLENNAGQIEVVKLTNRSGGTLTIAAPGAVYSWASGSIVEARPCREAVAAIAEDSIHDASAETTIADGDESAFVDVSASNVLKKITWANFKATLKTYFDTLYTAISTCLPLAGGTLTGDLTMSGASIVEAEGAAVTAASSTNIWATDGNTVHVTGNTGIADFATAPQAGAWMKVIFDGTPILTQSANLNLNAGGADITIAAGDMALVYADTTTQMDVFVIRKSGTSVVTSTQKIVQVVEGTPYTTYSSTNAAIPNDDTIPQITEGYEWATVTITPTSASNRLLIEADMGLVATNIGMHIFAALFQDSTADALAVSGCYASSGAGAVEQMRVVHEMPAGTTSPTTFRLRSGPYNSAYNMYVNGNSSGRYFYGKAAVRIRVTEITP